MRKFAFFLPQFHTIPENNKWWGEGFTEWTRVKEAKPLFNGHQQPQKPLGNNYYNLLDKETVEWQTSLLKQYNVQGLIYYHYWFTGKLLLEKPAENLLKWKDIDQPFFFCWANHSWIKSWEGSSEILIKQEYGSEEDWEKHFQYLLQFFNDPRYEKKDNKPLFMIFDYRISQKEQLFRYFDKRCKDHGFDGIFLIETITFSEKQKAHDILKYTWSGTSRYFLREPLAALNFYAEDSRFSIAWLKICFKYVLCKFGVKQAVKIRSASDLYESMSKHFFKDPKWIHGIFFSWDNTPRHKDRGYIITSPSEEALERYISLIKDEEYLFINAWNEWAEGMFLEPTEEKKYEYLEWIKKYL